MRRYPARSQNMLVKAPVSASLPIAAPLAGWNSRDQTVEIPPNGPPYAIFMENFFVNDDKIKLRKGSSEYATGLNGIPKTLMPFKSGTTEKLFAATADSIYEVTASGAVGAAAVTSLSNALWRFTMHSTTSGDYLLCANGADGLRTYDGSTWAKSTLTTLTDAEVDSVTAHKERLWMIKKNTLDAYYLPTFSIDNGGGAETKFPLGAKCNKGGFLVAIATWTRDGGDGVDDLLCFITSEGEVLVYSGTNPASDFAHIGTYLVDKPLGKRCTAKFGGDLIILTERGPLPMSRINDMVGIDDVIPEAIQPAFKAASSVARAYDGWNILTYDNRGWLIFNVPTVTDSQSEQYVMDMDTRTWWKFTGWNAMDFAEVSNGLYFAGTGTSTYWADTGTADDSAAIEGKVGLGWSRFGTPFQKSFGQVRAYTISTGDVKLTFEMVMDFRPSEITGANETSIATDGADWDVELWDVAEWGETRGRKTDWYGLTGTGHVGSLQFAVKTTTQEIEIASLDLMLEVGNMQ